MSMKSWARWLCFLLPAVVLVGCLGDGNKLAPVKGKVMYKGKAVPNGTVTFNPDNGPTATGEIQPDGSYVLKTNNRNGAVLGKHRVTIIAMEDMSKRLPEERNPLPPPIVPNKYTSLATTDLTADVKDGDNNIDFTLQEEEKGKKGAAK